MSKIIKLISLLLFFAVSGATQVTGVTPLISQDVKEKSLVKVEIDWPKFMARHDLIWNRMPADYFEGAFVGNGLLGTIIFKDDIEPNTLRFEIEQTDVYDHRTKTSSAYETSRLPIGQLLQDWGGIVRVFPAMPLSWKDASFHNLLAQGGFLVSGVRKRGVTQFVRNISQSDQTCRIKVDFTGEVHLAGAKSAGMRQNNGVIELDLKKGEETVLYAGKKPDSFVIKPLPMDPGAMNSWGSKAIPNVSSKESLSCDLFSK